MKDIANYSYDYILVNSIYSYKILNLLKKKGIEESKILFLKGHPDAWSLPGEHSEIHYYEYSQLKKLIYNADDFFEGSINNFSISIRRIIRIEDKRNKVNQFLEARKIYYQFLRKKKKNEMYILLSSIIGDSVFALALLTSIKLKYKKRIVIYADKKLKALVGLYQGYDEVRYIKQEIIAPLIFHSAYYMKKGIKEGIICTVPFVLYGYKTPYNCLELFKIMLDLPDNHNIVFPMVSEKVIAIQNFYQISHKIIILNPYWSSGEECICQSLFERLSVYLKKEGFIVYTNIIKEQKVINGTLPLRCSYVEFYEIARNIPLVVSVRSGILDLIISAGCSICAIYPEVTDEQIRWERMFTLEQWGCDNIMEERVEDENISYEHIISLISEVQHSKN